VKRRGRLESLHHVDVAGLISISNGMTIMQTTPEELAERCLRSNSYLAMKKISCDYLNGVLVLRGHVETYFLKQVAQVAVAQVEGVDRVDNQIEVFAPAIRAP
jgi:osmotically-inducible protein OsmY